MTDDAIRERHGMRCVEAGDNSASSVTIWEEADTIVLDGSLRSRRLTQWQARYLAAKLYRLSRRIRDRAGEAQ